MSDTITYWDRFHVNHTMATVMCVSGRYAATVTRDGSDAHTPTWTDTLKEAQAHADGDAHPDCDGTCPPWTAHAA
jgi:hypothetical protein